MTAAPVDAPSITAPALRTDLAAELAQALTDARVGMSPSRELWYEMHASDRLHEELLMREAIEHVLLLRGALTR